MAYKSVRTWMLRPVYARLAVWLAKAKGLRLCDIGQVRFIGDGRFLTFSSEATKRLRLLDNALFEKILNGEFHYTILKVPGVFFQNYYSGVYSITAFGGDSEIALMIFLVRRYYLTVCTQRKFSAFFFKDRIASAILDSERLVTEWLREKRLEDWIDESRREFRN